MGKIFDDDFVKKLNNLKIPSLRTTTSRTSGNRKSKEKGTSLEFSDYREYTPGDDFKRVDWTAYARFEKLYLKLFMEEREMPVNIFLDISNSMDWGEPNKNIASRRLVAALSYISLAAYDRVSLVLYNDRIAETMLSVRGKNRFPELLGLLESVPCSGASHMGPALSGFDLKNRNAVSFLVSDLLPPEHLEEVIKYLKFLKQTVYICHMLSPEEVMPRIETDSRLTCVETGAYRDIACSKSLIAAYERVFKNYISHIENCCRKHGAFYISLISSMKFEEMVKKVIGI